MESVLRRQRSKDPRADCTRTPLDGALALLALALAVLGCAAEGEEGPGAERPRRIVVITLDTLRADYLDPNSDDGRMPKTRAFARRGAWFDNFWAASSATQPTHATLFTGLHPWEHGVVRNGTVLADHHRTVAERFSEAGFATAAVVASYPLHPRFGFNQGFDVFLHEFGSRLYGPEWEGSSVEGQHFYELSGAVTDRALALFDTTRFGDQFFWLHYFDAHEPYGDESEIPIPTLAMWRSRERGGHAYERTLRLARRGYDEDVARVDAALGRLFRRLDAQSDRFETHVVLTSDHGESFGEHGAVGHGSRVTRAQVQAPLVIVSPRVTPGVRSGVAGTADLAATLIGLAGLSDAESSGRSLLLPARLGTGIAVGMTGAVSEPYRAGERRQHRFFLVRGSEHYAGTAQTVTEGDVPERVVTDEAVAGPLRALFERFAAALTEVPTTDRTDPQTLEALQALEYVEASASN
jgi:arylsulfatase A-like enzyme